ncbi:MAG: porin family protein, partial [Bacteroidota bacterium]
SQNDFRGGLMAGVLGTQMSGDRLAGFDKVGLQAGAFVGIPLGSSLSAEIELYYITKGSQQPTNPDDPDRSTFGYRFNYVEMPLMLQYNITDSWRGIAGGYFGVLTSSKVIFNNIDRPIENPEPSSTDIGLIIGAGYQITPRFQVELRYSQSIIPVRDFADTGFDPIFDAGMYHSILHFVLKANLSKK